MKGVGVLNSIEAEMMDRGENKTSAKRPPPEWRRKLSKEDDAHIMREIQGLRR